MMLLPFAHCQSRRTARVDLFRSLPTVQNGMDVLRCFVAAQIVIVASNETERKRHTHKKWSCENLYRSNDNENVCNNERELSRI